MTNEHEERSMQVIVRDRYAGPQVLITRERRDPDHAPAS
jgi:hypothetical protein